MKKITQQQLDETLKILKDRFTKNMDRHADLEWDEVALRLKESEAKIWSLMQMELTGGEPDVIGVDEKTNELIFCDCSKESPMGRRNTCYDQVGQSLREKQGLKVTGNAVEMAKSMGAQLLSEEGYHLLQRKGEFDLKTSSWLETSAAIRKLGGAIFGDRRYDHVFIYHNGAQSFYSARGFRCMLKV